MLLLLAEYLTQFQSAFRVFQYLTLARNSRSRHSAHHFAAGGTCHDSPPEVLPDGAVDTQ